MGLDTVAEKAGADGPGRSYGSLLTRSVGRFRLALSRTRPYILAAGAIYVGAFLVTFILRDGVILPEDRWLLRQPIVQQPLDLDVGFAEWVYVFRHNVVADLLGIATAGLPKILINAYALGESAASAHAASKGGVFWSLILPHGPLEMADSFVATGVGLRVGGTLVARIRHRSDRRGGVGAALRDGIVLTLALSVPATAVAALIEVELSTMWMPLPLATLFGVLAAATFVAMILAIAGPAPGTTGGERGSTVDDQDATLAEEGTSGRGIPEEDMATARIVLGDIAAGGPALDVVLKPASRDARAACVRMVNRGRTAPDLITAAVVAGLARRALSSLRKQTPKLQALWIAYVLFMSLLVAVTDTAWIEGIGLGILGTVLSLRTMSRIRRSEHVNRELVDQALRGEIAISIPPSITGLEAAFWEAVEPKTSPQTAPRLQVF